MSNSEIFDLKFNYSEINPIERQLIRDAFVNLFQLNQDLIFKDFEEAGQ